MGRVKNQMLTKNHKDYFGNKIEMGDEVLFYGPVDDAGDWGKDNCKGSGLVKGKIVVRDEQDCTPCIERLYKHHFAGVFSEWLEKYILDCRNVIVLKYIKVEKDDE